MSQPAAARLRAQSTQRTGLAIWSTSACRTSSARVTRPPEAFEAIGTLRVAHATSVHRLGHPRLRGLHQLAVEGGADLEPARPSPRPPPARAPSAARRRPTSPETTICGGRVQVRGGDEARLRSLARRAPRARSCSRPMTAAIVPGRSVWASFISLPRRATRRMPSSNVERPATRPPRCTRRGCGRRRRSGLIPSSAASLRDREREREERRLGDVGPRQLSSGPFEGVLGDRHPGRVRRSREEALEGLGPRLPQVGAHADLLRALTGEEERELAHVCLLRGRRSGASIPCAGAPGDVRRRRSALGTTGRST